MKKRSSTKRVGKKKKTFGNILLVNLPFTDFPMLFIYMGLIIFFAVFSPGNQPFKMKMEYSNKVEGISTLYYNDKNGQWKTDDTLESSISHRQVRFSLTRGKVKYLKWLRFDPLMDSGKVHIKKVTIYYRGFPVQEFTGKQFRSQISSSLNVKLKTAGDELHITSQNEDPQIIMSYQSVHDLLLRLEDYAHIIRCVYITILMALLMVIITFREEIGEVFAEIAEKSSTDRLTVFGYILYVVTVLFAALALVVYMLREFLLLNFNGLSFEEIIFHLKMPMEGTGSSMIEDFFDDWLSTIITFAVITVVVIVLLVIFKKFRNCKYVYRLTAVIALVALVVQTFSFADKLDVVDYIKAQNDSSTFIEENYVSPKSAKISFPSKKRNLIWIYMESMESTFISKDKGGDMPENLLPEMTKLAEDNINFSESSKVGGATSSTGTGWTIAAMFAQTSGLPLLIPIEGNSYGEYSSFAPGAYSLGQVLGKQGYNQELMVGSDVKFGGRKLYFKQHGNYDLYDLYTAREKGKIPKNYKVWWGFEDQKLYSYAKEEINRLAKEDEPFQFSMLTVDTHHIGGYYCKLCKKQYKDRYKNVLACASRQVTDFVSWIRKQDFYDNTTIVISGDHPTMDNNFIKAYYDKKQPRKVYNCFINSAVKTKYDKEREFNTFDMYPTVLASMGIKVDGERLGLGTNLFSGDKTLAEKYGYDKIDSEFDKNSKFYKKKILKE